MSSAKRADIEEEDLLTHTINCGGTISCVNREMQIDCQSTYVGQTQV